jgi:DNA-binding CsgD family transcriptional regulator
VVSGEAVRALLDTSAAAGFAVERLCVGLSFDLRSVRRMRRVPWDDYCVLVERVTEDAGGLDQFEDLLARSYHLSAPGWRLLGGALIQPRLLYKALSKAVNLFPAVYLNYTEASDGRLRGICRLVPDARPCLAFFRGTVGVFRGLPGHLGQPMAEVEIEEITERSLVALVQPPPSRTLLARARSLVAGGGSVPAPAPALAALALLAAAGRKLDLTPRQEEVLGRLVRGLANKEIAVELDCTEATVEAHLTQVLRKAGAQSRTQLIARFWSGDLR